MIQKIKAEVEQDDLAFKLEKLKLLEAKQKMESELPHLYGFNLYRWQREFIESTNKMTIMVAANQIGKSSAQWLKAIRWATDKTIWPKIFAKDPKMFLYFMPSLKLITREIETKIIPEYLPRGDQRDNGPYRWEAKYAEEIEYIYFPETDVRIQFLSYASDPHKAFQAMSPHAVFADEEMPAEIFGEIITRLQSHEEVTYFDEKKKKTITNPGAYFHLVCTPTRGEQMWEDAFNGHKFEKAKKMQVSLYECTQFEDGSPGKYSVPKIEEIKQTLPDQRSIEVRVYGKFSKIEGLLFSSFDRLRNVGPRMDLGANCLYFGGIDYGSGGQYGHAGACCIVQVNSDRTMAQVFRLWKGNHKEKTTASDILHKYLDLRAGINCAGEYYDWAASDLGVIAQREGLPIQKANKDAVSGYGLINSLFKNNMLHIPNEPEFYPLIKEIERARESTKKKDLDDDAADAMRFALANIPFDFSKVVFDPHFKPRVKRENMSKYGRPTTRAEMIEVNEFNDEIEEEISDYNKFLEIL